MMFPMLGHEFIPPDLFFLYGKTERWDLNRWKRSSVCVASIGVWANKVSGIKDALVVSQTVDSPDNWNGTCVINLAG